MFQCHQKDNLARWQMPKLCLCWHKSVWFPLTSAISEGVFVWFRWSGAVHQAADGRGNQVRGKWEPDDRPVTCSGSAAVERLWFKFRDKVGMFGSLHLFPDRSRPQSAHVTLILQTHYEHNTFKILPLFSSQPLPRTDIDIKYILCTICHNMYFMDISFFHSNR